MSGRVELFLHPDLQELRRMDDAIEQLAVEQDWSAKLSFQVKLILEELVINVMNYGFPEGMDRPDIEVRLDSTPERLVIEIADQGQPFDPFTEAPAEDVTSALEDRAIGGLGVHLVQTMVDEATYTRDGNYNRVRLLKRR